MLGNVSKCNTFDDMLPRVLALCGQAASCSVVHLPELPAASILGHSIYDIRGSMTGPGGEDHGESVSTLFRIGRREVLLCLSNLSSLWTKVACVALKRLVSEGSELSARLIGSSSDIIPHLCHVHRGLKLIETERGQGVHYGRGVTPKSRRMLLACICDLETAAGGQGGASPMLYQLFEDTVRMVASFKSRVQQLSDKDVFACCEAVLDLGSFPSSAICSLFAKQPNEPSTMTECLEVLNAIGVQGYRRISTGDQGDSRDSAWLMQWNRLRAALFFLFKHSASPDLAPIACAMIQTLVTAECEAVHRQCMAGPSSSSSLFQDELVSSEFVPAGLFIRVVGEVVMCARRKSQTCSTLAGCFSTICELSDPVLSSICHPCSEPHSGAFADPRPTIIEAWLFTLVELLTSFDFALPGSQLERTVTETFIAVLTLLFNPSMGKTSEERALDKGPSLDGPQSLALMAFVTSFFERGASLLETVSNRLLHTMPVAFDSDAGGPGHRGAAIIVAAILRAIQGALPPWAVESVPEVFSSFYSAIGKDASSFEVILRLSMIVRNNSQEDMGGVKTGSLLSGHYFETMSGQAKTQFVTQAVNLAQKDNASSWRRLKVLVKAACGGKKKETDFGQKPSLTRWDFERV